MRKRKRKRRRAEFDSFFVFIDSFYVVDNELVRYVDNVQIAIRKSRSLHIPFNRTTKILSSLYICNLFNIAYVV